MLREGSADQGLGLRHLNRDELAGEWIEDDHGGLGDVRAGNVRERGCIPGFAANG